MFVPTTVYIDFLMIQLCFVYHKCWLKFYVKKSLVSISGRDYVFDIKRTAREALDFARRQRYQMTQDVVSENKVDLKTLDSKGRLQPAEERCKVN